MDLLLHRVDAAGALSYQIQPNAKRVSGISQLIQEVVVELLSDFDPITNRGSDLQRGLAGIHTGADGSARSIAATSVSVVLGVIIGRQQRNTTLTGQERLQDLTLLSISAAATGTWDIELQLTPASGSPTNVIVGGV